MKGRDAAVAMAVWAAFNIALAALMFLFTDDLMSHVVAWLAILWVVPAIALALVARDRDRRWLPQASGGAVVLALALTFIALGAGLGLWAALSGAALGVVAVVMLLLERSA